MNKEQGTPEEIDLRDLLNYALSQKWKIIGVAILLSLITGLYQFSLAPYYDVQTTVYSTLLSSKEVAPYLDNFETICNSSSSELISKNTSLSPEVSEKISNMDIGTINQEGSLVTCKIAFAVTDTAISTQVVQSLVDYVSRVPYFLERLEFEKDELNYLIVESEQEIEELRQLKDKMTSSSLENSFPYPLNLNSDLLRLQEKFAHYKKQRSLLTLVDILSHPINPIEPTGPKAAANSLIVFVIVMVAGFFGSAAIRLFLT